MTTETIDWKLTGKIYTIPYLFHFPILNRQNMNFEKIKGQLKNTNYHIKKKQKNLRVLRTIEINDQTKVIHKGDCVHECGFH